MEYLRPIIDWLTTEHLKTAAALFQAAGVFIGAFFAYKLGRRLEKHKYDMKLKEIMHANTQKRRLETLENIVGLMGKILFEMRDIPVVIGSPKPPVERKEGESIQDWQQRQYDERSKTFNLEIHSLFQACEAGTFYLPEGLYSRLEKFRMDSGQVVGDLYSAMLGTGMSPHDRQILQNKYLDGWEKMKKERDQIVEIIAKNILP